MRIKPKIYRYKNMRSLATRLRDDLNNQDFVLLYAYNGTGKTRLSMAFKDVGKRKRGIERDTLYFNAYTEDLFHWDNDLEGDSERLLKLNSASRFFFRLQGTSVGRKDFCLPGALYRFRLPDRLREVDHHLLSRRCQSYQGLSRRGKHFDLVHLPGNLRIDH